MKIAPLQSMSSCVEGSGTATCKLNPLMAARCRRRVDLPVEDVMERDKVESRRQDGAKVKYLAEPFAISVVEKQSGVICRAKEVARVDGCSADANRGGKRKKSCFEIDFEDIDCAPRCRLRVDLYRACLGVVKKRRQRGRRLLKHPGVEVVVRIVVDRPPDFMAPIRFGVEWRAARLLGRGDCFSVVLGQETIGASMERPNAGLAILVGLPCVSPRRHRHGRLKQVGGFGDEISGPKSPHREAGDVASFGIDSVLLFDLLQDLPCHASGEIAPTALPRLHLGC